MTKNMIIYVAEADVGGYSLKGSGLTPKQAINVLWKEYRDNWAEHYWGYGTPTKKEWLEYHDISEDSCEEIEIGKAWVR